MQDNAVIVFLRAPQKGRVKTRLAQHLDQGLVLELYRAFVLDTLETAQALGRPLIFFTPPDQEDMIRKWLGTDYDYAVQKDGNIGERMADAFLTVFKNGAKRCVLIGTDIPQLDKDLLIQAVEMLLEHDAVVGPSQDGGYYLIGFGRDRFSSAVFDSIDWSTHRVTGQTLAALEKEKLSYSLLPALNDIDSIEDFNALIQQFQAGCNVGGFAATIVKGYMRGDI